MVWIGIDDTDSKIGGCTTYIGYVIVKGLIENGVDIIGFPRLVRLNPNIPWKTRGNGAVAIQAGRGGGKRILVGKFEGEKIFSYEYKTDDVDKKIIESVVRKEVEEYALMHDENTNPGYVISEKKPDIGLYFRAVRDIVSVDYILNELDRLGAVYRGYKNRRGLIGALASISWEPGDRTYEIIFYRYRERWGRERYVDEKTVINMDRKIKTTFDNYDYENRRVLITPNSPCPVLFGIRGENPEDLIKAKDMIISEDYIGWIIYETNQGTDDHLERKKIADIRPYQSVIVEGVVDSDPVTIEGGHVIFRIKDETGAMDCAAYEPTKNFRNVIRKLRRGDRVEVYGGVREEPFTINVEKIRIINLIKIRRKIENPICDRCGIHMKSMGRNQGYRCRKCGSTKGEEEANYGILDRELKEDFYEVPPCARRHLSKPLKRMLSAR